MIGAAGAILAAVIGVVAAKVLSDDSPPLTAGSAAETGDLPSATAATAEVATSIREPTTTPVLTTSATTTTVKPAAVLPDFVYDTAAVIEAESKCMSADVATRAEVQPHPLAAGDPARVDVARFAADGSSVTLAGLLADSQHGVVLAFYTREPFGDGTSAGVVLPPPLVERLAAAAVDGWAVVFTDEGDQASAAMDRDSARLVGESLYVVGDQDRTLGHSYGVVGPVIRGDQAYCHDLPWIFTIRASAGDTPTISCSLQIPVGAKEFDTSMLEPCLGAA